MILGRYMYDEGGVWGRLRSVARRQIYSEVDATIDYEVAARTTAPIIRESTLEVRETVFYAIKISCENQPIPQKDVFLHKYPPQDNTTMKLGKQINSYLPIKDTFHGPDSWLPDSVFMGLPINAAYPHTAVHNPIFIFIKHLTFTL